MNKGFVSIISVLAGAAAGVSVVKRITSKQTDKNKELADKHLALYLRRIWNRGGIKRLLFME